MNQSREPIIEGEVYIHGGNIFGNNVILKGPLFIGMNNIFYDNVVVGNPPQHREFDSENSKYAIFDKLPIRIGNGNIFREGVSVHKPTKETGTVIHDRCYIMCNTHIPHDAELFDNVCITSGTNMAGFIKIMRNSTLALNVSTHQYVTIGSYVMVGMGSVVTKDIPPFSKAYGNPCKVHGQNTIGMKRAGLDINCDSLANTLAIQAEWDMYDKLKGRRER